MGKIMKRGAVLFGILLLAMLFSVMAGAQKAEAAVKLNKTKATLAVNEILQLKLTGTSKKVKWSSSNKSVASVTGGKVKAKKEGEATITAKVGKKSYRCKITVKGNYKAFYKAFLEKGVIKDGNYNVKASYYYVLNVDKSGVPELIVSSDGGGITVYYVYTVRNGKVVKLGDYATRGISVVPYFYYVSKYKGLMASGWTNGVGGSWSNMYAVSGKKLVRTYHAREEHYQGDKYWTGTTDKKEKRVSRSACSAFVKKYFGKYKKYNMLGNTDANRTKSFG